MIQKSPFKFLDSFTKDDRDIFFGRDKEIEELHSRVFEALTKAALTKAPFEHTGASGSSYNFERLLRSVYVDHFKPVFLIFDQFEELFIFGGKDEKNELIKNVAKVVGSEIQCRFIFALGGEHLAGVTEFERVIPSFLAK